MVAEVECPSPENPANGRAVFTRQAYNSVVSYECNYGYSLVGDATRRCGADRRWSGHKPSCQGESQGQASLSGMWFKLPLQGTETIEIPRLSTNYKVKFSFLREIVLILSFLSTRVILQLTGC